MLILGFLLLLLAAAVIAYMVMATAGQQAITVDYGILNLEIPPLWLFLSGALTVALAAIGLWMMAAGARTKARKAREVRELRKQAKATDRRVERSGDATAPRPTTGSPRPDTVPGPTGTGSGSYGSGSYGSGSSGTTDRSRLDLDR